MSEILLLLFRSQTLENIRLILLPNPHVHDNTPPPLSSHNMERAEDEGG